MNKTQNQHRQAIYAIDGMYCSSCELLIERKLSKLKEIKKADVSLSQKQATITYTGKTPTVIQLNKLFAKEKYKFNDQSSSDLPPAENQTNQNLLVLIVAVLVIGVFLALNKLGFSALSSVGTASSLPAFFIFGLLAGLSTCAALVGGLILSLSKQWSGLYGKKKSFSARIQPHLMFNLGRLISYGLVGALLGAVGSFISPSPIFYTGLVLAVSVLMVGFGLQMLGIKGLKRWSVFLPKFFTRQITNEKNFQGRYMPWLMGALTVFLPCGFTITTQGLAVVSGSSLRGALIMLIFALGTAPSLLAIGVSSLQLTKKPKPKEFFYKLAGVLVLFFALFNINSQLNVLGLRSANDLGLKTAVSAESDGLVSTVDGYQVIKMDAFASAYEPNSFKVRAGIPVKWEITDKGTSGCTNAVISTALFDGQIPLTHGQVSTKEFTPEKTGRYKFSCWMGMVSGVIEVVEENGSVGEIQAVDEAIDSGSTGCGCGSS